MKKSIYDLTKEELQTLTLNYYSNMQKISQLYLKSKTENKYLNRRLEKMEQRVKYFVKLVEKKNDCKITFNRIDGAIKKENKRKRTPKIIFENAEVENNGNAKDERIQS